MQFARAAPANLVTADQVAQLQAEAKQKQAEARSHLQKEMQSQYYGTIAEKQSARLKQKRLEAEEMSRAVEFNRELDQQERA